MSAVGPDLSHICAPGEHDYQQGIEVTPNGALMGRCCTRCGEYAGLVVRSKEAPRG